MTAAADPAADILRWHRALLHRYAALHEGNLAAGEVGLPAELQRWLRGEAPLPERLARARAADAEVRALRSAVADWSVTGPAARWRHLLSDLADHDRERDLLVLLLGEALSPRAAAALRLLSGWSDSSGIERSFLQALLDPLEQEPEAAAALLRADHRWTRLGLVRGLEQAEAGRLAFVRLAPLVLAWLEGGAERAVRGDRAVAVVAAERHRPPRPALELLGEDLDRAEHLLKTHPGALRAVVRAATADDVRLMATGLAQRLQRDLVVCDVAGALRRDPHTGEAFDSGAVVDALERAALLALLGDGMLLVVGLSQDEGGRSLEPAPLVQTLVELPAPVLLEDAGGGEGPSLAAGLARMLTATALTLPFPDRTTRSRAWVTCLPVAEEQAPTLQGLAAFPLSLAQIDELTQAIGAGRYSLSDREGLADACRERIGHRVGDVAQRVTATATWQQVVLPEPVLAVTHEIIAYARYGEQVLNDWGFAARYHYGLGLTALFSGPPGTGKTMLAGLVARELGLDLYRVDLSRILSKYIGETEQRLGRLFEEGKRGGVALLFDEADSLFARRTEVRSSVDRYANLEVNFLLQKMEEYSGVVILTTNFADSIDEAFKRRIRFHAQFPLPGAHEREQLWLAMLPAQTPLEDDVPFELLAEAYEFSGGEIKNAVLRAAFYAAVAQGPITFELLDRAAQAECHERGRLVLRTASSLRW